MEYVLLLVIGVVLSLPVVGWTIWRQQHLFGTRCGVCGYAARVSATTPCPECGFPAVMPPLTHATRIVLFLCVAAAPMLTLIAVSNMVPSWHRYPQGLMYRFDNAFGSMDLPVMLGLFGVLPSVHLFALRWLVKPIVRERTLVFFVIVAVLTATVDVAVMGWVMVIGVMRD